MWTSVLDELRAKYARIWVVDTEYQIRPGCQLRPICICGVELVTGERISRWVWGESPGAPPWDPSDPNTLIVCFSATAECGFSQACGWVQPRNVLDLWLCYRLISNGLVLAHGTKLLRVLKVAGIETPVDDEEKKYWRQLCIDGGPFTADIVRGILRYCMSDVLPLIPLMAWMLPQVDVEKAIRLADYSISVAKTEYRGISVDVDRLRIFQDRWAYVRAAAAMHANSAMRFQMFGGLTPASFRYSQFEEYLSRKRATNLWGRTESGRLRTDKAMLKAWASRDEDFGHFRQAREVMTMLHPSRIYVGDDGRCRTSLRNFSTRTSRNAPQAHWPLAYPAGIRPLIYAHPDSGMAHVMFDLDQADPAMGAILANDPEMLDCYHSPTFKPDFYVSFAAKAGELHADADKDDPKVKPVRDVFKTSACAIMYGVSEFGLAEILGVSFGRAKSIIRTFRQLFRVYGAWSANELDAARFDGAITTASGWRVNTTMMSNRSCKNWPIQTAGADALRLASLLIDKAGIPIVAPLHDAVLCEIPVAVLDDAVETVKKLMADATEAVVGLRLRVGAQVMKPGQRYYKDDKTRAWWTAMSGRLGVEP